MWVCTVGMFTFMDTKICVSVLEGDITALIT